jgi:flagellar assembly protein FliH
MFETIVRLSQSPQAIHLIDPNAAVIDAGVDVSHSVVDAAAARRAAEAARQAQEQEAVQKVLERLGDVVRQFNEQREQLLREMQQVAIELAVSVASQAIHAKIEANEFPIESLVRAAIGKLDSSGPIVVRLHPDDLALFKRRADESGSSLSDSGIRFDADASLGRGDCRADAGELGVWCKMQGQIEEMRQRLLETLEDAEIERRKTAAGDSGLRRFPDRRQTA